MIPSLVLITASCRLVHLLLISFSASMLARTLSSDCGPCFNRLALLPLPTLLPPAPIFTPGGSVLTVRSANREAFIFFLEVVLLAMLLLLAFLLTVVGGGSMSVMAFLSDPGRFDQTKPLILPVSLEGVKCAEVSSSTVSSSCSTDVPICWLMCNLSSFSTGGLLLCLSPEQRKQNIRMISNRIETILETTKVVFCLGNLCLWHI